MTKTTDKPFLTANHRLAVYGTLAPGRVNHDQLEAIKGTWTRGTIRGRFVEGGWGAGLGYPAMVPDDQGLEIGVFLLQSPELPNHWERLDQFEGSGYQRVIVPVQTEDGLFDASIYCLMRR